MKILEKLEPATNYTCNVLAVNGAGNGNKSNCLTFPTKDGESDPINELINITSINHMILKWNPPNNPKGTIDKYDVVVYKILQNTTEEELQISCEQL